MFRSDEKGDYKSSRADLVVLVVLGLDKQIGPVLGGQAVTPVQIVRVSERLIDICSMCVSS